MEFEELPAFTRQVLALLDDAEYAQLQESLAARPDAGKLLPHSGGLRKLRWAAGGRGQRGGLRVIYYWWVGDRLISLLAVYAKNRKADLTVAEIRQLREIIEGE